MSKSEAHLRTRAAALAEEISAEIPRGPTSEWLEEVLGSALLDVARQELARCAAIAEARAVLWEGTAHRMSSGAWPAAAVIEARERSKEAIFIADAIRADDSPWHDHPAA
jgi:hypothetical protein